MYTKRIFWFAVACAVLSSGLLIGCGEDDGGDPGAQFNGVLLNRITRNPVIGKTVKALDNVTGDVIPGQEAVTGAGGSLSFSGLPGSHVGFWAVAELGGAYIETYQFNIATDGQDEELWAVDKGTYDLAPKLGGITIDITKAAIAGGYYWVNPDSGNEEPVGCGTVAPQVGGADIRYFGGNDLPVEIVANDPDCGLDGINPLNGTFLLANMNAGPGQVLQGFDADGNQNGSSTLPGIVGDKTIIISNIYATGDVNPKPADCVYESKPECN